MADNKVIKNEQLAAFIGANKSCPDDTIRNTN